MKTFFNLVALILIFACIAPSAANAQVSKNVTLSKSSLSSTDTSFAVVTAEDYTRSFTVVATKTSGTVAGKIYLYASGDGTNYDKLDSLVVADVAGAQYKTFKPTLPLVYYKYKIYALSTGGVWAIAAKQLTRRY